MTKIFKRALPLLLAITLLTGCGQTGNPSEAGTGSETAQSGVGAEEDLDTASGLDFEGAENEAYVEEVDMGEVELAEEIIALSSGSAAVMKKVKPVASGTKVAKQQKATIDYSNTTDGYFMVKYTATTSKRLRVKVTGPQSEYIHDIKAGQWETFTLADGNGSYTVKVYENTTGSKYAVVCTATFTAKLKDEFGPFLYSNQYVNYEDAKNTVAQAEKLAGTQKDAMKKVEAVYNYVVKNLKYDNAFADAVRRGEKNGYMPDLDSVLKSKKGVCFDYAALMAGMLRSQGVPCKLVMGYASNSEYHAWINVYSEKDGWINGAVRFNGKKWMLMDPTWASGNNNIKYQAKAQSYQATSIY